MNDLITHVLIHERQLRLREYQDQPHRRTRPLPRTHTPTHRRFQRRR